LAWPLASCIGVRIARDVVELHAADRVARDANRLPQVARSRGIVRATRTRMTPIDANDLAAVTGGAGLSLPASPSGHAALSFPPSLLTHRPSGLRLPPQRPAVIRGPAGGIPLVIDRHDGGPPNVIKGPPVGPLF
jgi:hypothetical protein